MVPVPKHYAKETNKGQVLKHSSTYGTHNKTSTML